MNNHAEIQRRLNDFLEHLYHQGDAIMAKYNQLQSAVDEEGFTIRNIAKTMSWRKRQVELYESWLEAFRGIKQDAGLLQYGSCLYNDIVNTEILLVKSLNEAKNNLNKLVKSILNKK